MEANTFDLFFNQRYNLCYGYFLKQMQLQVIKYVREIKAVKHPSIIKQVSYRSLVEELWRTPISDDPEEGAVLKKTIANCSTGCSRSRSIGPRRARYSTPTRTPSSS
ncbi:MAG: hypothetical protein ACKPKO_13505, partial [Candidatus Fonsibacter sp.]